MTWASAAPLLRRAHIRAVEFRYLPGEPLMQRAGQAAASVARQLVLPGKPVLVLCGPGNNGGDGFVLASVLASQGHAVEVVFRGEPAALPDDARAACADWCAHHPQSGKQPPWWSDWPARPDGDWGLVVDALFGIGLMRPLQAPYDAWVQHANALPCPRLALDVPSGLDADTGHVQPVCLRATHTATFIAAKPGLFTLDGPDHAGEVSVHQLGVHLPDDILRGDEALMADAAVPMAGRLNHEDGFRALCQPRRRNSHKGLYGDVVVVGGAPGMVGAAWLAGRAAVGLGAGRVFVLGFAPDMPAVDPLQPELMLRRWPDWPAGTGVLAVGPGLGQGACAVQALHQAVSGTQDLILDADALNLLAQSPELQHVVRQRHAATLLTPHPLEAARLLACSTAEVQADRVASARRLAHEYQAYVVLKGCGSVLATPQGAWWVNPTGSPGLASGGMGDVLTGMLAALLAQHQDPQSALLAACWLHGRAAEALAAAGEGPVGLAAGELIPVARRVLNRLSSPVECGSSVEMP